MAFIKVCSHCGDKNNGKGKFCKFCDSADKRKEMDENNKKIWDDIRTNPENPLHNPKLKEFNCRFCSKKEKPEETESSSNDFGDEDYN